MPVSLPPSPPAPAGTSSSSSPLPPQNILLLGLRRSGKSSLLSVVYKALPPHETLFLDSTLRSHSLDVCAWEPVRFWDGPGLSASAAEAPAGAAAAAAQEKGKATGTAGALDWTQLGAVIFVIDAQDDYFDALARLHAVLLDAYAHNPDIQFHVFVHKVDGLSDDYKYDTQRDIEQRVLDNLSDASASFAFAPSAYEILRQSAAAAPALSALPSAPASAVGARAAGDHANPASASASAFASLAGQGTAMTSSALARAAGLTPETHTAGSSGVRPGEATSPRPGGSHIAASPSGGVAGAPTNVNLDSDVRLTFHTTSIFDTSVNVAFSRVLQGLLQRSMEETLEALCNSLCSANKLDKVFLFDVPTRTYIAADTSPFDRASFDVASEYVAFLTRFADLYSTLGAGAEAGETRHASSVSRLAPDTTLAFWQIDERLALLAMLRTHPASQGMLDFNVSLLRRSLLELRDLSRAA